MKKLNVLFAAFLVLVVLQFLLTLLTPIRSAQGAEEIGLTEIETLQISIMMKDLLLAQQRIQILQTQFQAVVTQRDQAQTELVGMIQRLRVAHQAPEEKFSFDALTLKFVPLPDDPDKK